jgi:alkylation response protein AidB-like acyl-CoA dehydrogenase
MRRTIFDAEHDDFRAVVRAFLRKEAVPHTEEWEEAGMVPRAFWERAAEHGFVGFEAPSDYGGADLSDFRFNAVLDEEVAYAGAVGDNFTMQNDIVVPYLTDLTNDEQKARWLPAFTEGRLIVGLAMSEPGAGSDLQAMTTRAVRDGDGYVLDGTKTFVTSGIAADLVIVAARTDPAGGKHGFSLLAVERDTPGFSRGRKLAKAGRWAQDTAELFFDGVRVPGSNLLGEEGQGLPYLMRNLPRERLSMAISAVAAAEHALEITLAYVKERRAFGQPIGSFQANRFALAELTTRTAAARAYVDRCIEAVNAGELTAAEAAGAKAWTTDLQNEVVDRCLQLHGGYGYMLEYEISRLWRDARVQRIYGGTNEIMYEIVGRSLGL